MAHAWLALVHSLQGDAAGTEEGDPGTLNLQKDYIMRAHTRLMLFVESAAAVSEVRLS